MWPLYPEYTVDPTSCSNANYKVSCNIIQYVSHWKYKVDTGSINIIIKSVSYRGYNLPAILLVMKVMV